MNALIWRLHQQSMPRSKRAASDKELSIIKGRSMCPYCKHTLAWYDLLPVFSWLLAGGRCRYCKKYISWQYPIVEISTAILFIVSYLFWPGDLSIFGIQHLVFSLWLAAIVMFMALIIYDLRWMILPNKIVFPLIAVGALIAIIRAVASSSPLNSVFFSVAALAVAGGIFYVLFQVSDGAWIGGGDVKLGFALGLLLGSPFLAFMMLFLASVFGILAAIPGILAKKSQIGNKLPFGPFLITSTIIATLFGQAAIDWYRTAFLYL